MTRNVIEAIGVGKRYRRQSGQNNLPTFRDALARRWSEWFGHKPHVMHLGLGKEDFWALRGVDFKVKEGEVVGLIGRNGAGKSTLLKILSRICEPTEGSIKIRGRVSALLEIGTGFHPELTGRENVYLNGAILGLRREEIHRKFDAIVDFSGVEAFLDNPVKHYSSGMQARLGFSVAAHLEPEILIVDEVLAVGDAVFQKKCLGKMRDAAGDGRTVLYVSHNLQSLRQLCDRGIILENGQINFDGLIEDSILSYARLVFQSNQTRKIIHQSAVDGFVVTKFGIYDFRGQECEQMEIGGDYIIKFYYKYDHRYGVIKNITAGIQMTNILGLQVVGVNTVVTGYCIDKIAGEGSINILFNRISLMPGEYAITFHINSPIGVLSKIVSGINVDVVDGDYYGVGRMCGSGREAIFMPDCEWSSD